MADESPEELVARIIRELLSEGGSARLIHALHAVQRILQEPDEPRGGTIATTLQAPQTSFGSPSGTITTRLQAPRTSFGPNIHAEVPTTTAVIRLEPKLTFRVVPAIRDASPELADKIQLSPPQDAERLLNLFMALMQVVQTLLTVYQITHSEPPTQTQIVQIFNNTTNYVIQMPQEHG